MFGDFRKGKYYSGTSVDVQKAGLLRRLSPSTAMPAADDPTSAALASDLTPKNCTCPEDKSTSSRILRPGWKRSVLSQRAQIRRGLKSTAATYSGGPNERSLEMSELVRACVREVESQSQEHTLM